MEKLKGLLGRHYYFGTSILMFLSFPSYDCILFKGFPFFAWFSLFPVFHFVKGKTSREVYWYSYGAGLLGLFLTYQWMGNFGAKVPGGYVILNLILIPVLAIIFAARVLAAEILSRKYPRLRVLIFPAVWVSVDWLTTLGYLAFPWIFWGYSQYPVTPLIQFSSVTGILGINFLMILSSSLVAEIFSRKGEGGATWRETALSAEAKRFYALAGFVAAVILAGAVRMAVQPKSEKSEFNVSLIQSCISPWENWSRNKFMYLKELLRLTDMSMGKESDLIVWSESATLEPISYRYRRNRSGTFDKIIFQYIKQAGIPLVSGEIGVIRKRFGNFTRTYPQNNAIVINKDGEVAGTYPKKFLVPFGEWVPYQEVYPFIRELANSMGGSNFVPGKGPMTFEVKGKKFGVLVCYEGIFHRYPRKYKKLGADFLINITNDFWTHTFNGHMQHFSPSKFRAIENGLWFVRAGNSGISTVIDPLGRYDKHIPILTKGYLVDGMDFKMNRKTLYTYIGDFFAYIIIAFTTVLSGLALYRRYRGEAG